MPLVEGVHWHEVVQQGSCELKMQKKGQLGSTALSQKGLLRPTRSMRWALTPTTNQEQTGPTKRVSQAAPATRKATYLRSHLLSFHPAGEEPNIFSC